MRPSSTQVLIALALAACGDDAALGGGGSGGAPGPATGGNGSGAGTADGGAGGAGAGGVPSAGGGPEGGSGGDAPGCRATRFGAGDNDFNFDWNGDDRTYRVHAPPSYDGSRPLPLVMVLHGYFETGDEIENISQMTPVTDARDYLVVYPDGRSTSWNAGACCGSSQQLGVDDVGFIHEMLDRIETDYCVDPKRVFSSGFSNGGMLSYRLACETADRFAAIGPVSGTLAIDACDPSRPVPIMHFHGTSDFVVPYDGGGFNGAQSVAETIAQWVTLNGCDPTPEQTFQQGDATCDTYAGCDAGADVTLCTLEGGGHQWPGGESAGPGGTINMDIFASEALLDFFDAHPLP